MKQKIATIQLGKNGLTEDFRRAIKSHFNNFHNVKISVLRSATRDKKQIKEYADKLVDELGDRYTARIIGFTIIIKEWRKPQTKLK